MKYILKLMTGICFLPFVILGGIIAVVRVILTSTLGLAWQEGDRWHVELLGKVNDFMQWIKK